MKLLFIAILVGCAFPALAQPNQLAPGETLVASSSVCPKCGKVHATQAVRSSGLLQSKANRMAREGRCRHVGGGYLSGARAEGVGMSSSSPQAAIRNCCYYGRRQLVGSAVARGPRGWYACCQYR